MGWSMRGIGFFVGLMLIACAGMPSSPGGGSPGPQLDPGLYSFFPGVTPGCRADPPEVEVVHVDRPTPIRGIVIERSGRYERVTVKGVDGWVRTAHPDDTRLLTVLSSDEPAACLQAELAELGDDHWFARTARWQSVLDLTTSEARRLGPVGGDLEGCRAAGEMVHCEGPDGPVVFDRDGVVANGRYKPAWSADLDP